MTHEPTNGNTAASDAILERACEAYWNERCTRMEGRLLAYDMAVALKDPLVPAVRQRMQAALTAAGVPELVAWKNAVIDELVVSHTLQAVHETDPKKAVHDAICWNVSVALDPQVSPDAQALIDRGRDELVAERDEARRVAQVRLRHLEAAVERSSIAINRATAAEARVAELEAAKERIAPVQGYKAGIPWSMHLEAYDAYSKKWAPQQALIEGGCRGGFSTGELDMFIPGWRERLSELTALRTRLTAAESKLAECSQNDARYRWLRHGDNDEEVMMTHEDGKARKFDYRFDASWLLRGNELDAAIDAAIAARGEG